MNGQTDVSAEMLNAYVDEQLGIEDKSRILDLMREDPSLALEACELLHVKQVLREAYAHPPEAEERPPAHRDHGFTWAAAVAFLALGLGSGWVASSALAPSPLFDTAQQVFHAASVEADDSKVLVHIATDDRERVDAAFRDMEKLLSSHAGKPQKVQLEVVANAEGLRILNADTSPYIRRIRDLVSNHDNVSFLGCRKAMEQMYLKGIKVHLMPEAGVVDEALEEVVNRIRQGWVYIRA